MVEIVIVGVLYLASFIGITWLILEEKDPNTLVVLMTAASTALLAYVNPRGTIRKTSDTSNNEKSTP